MTDMNVFSFEKYSSPASADGVMQQKTWDIVWLQIFAQMTGGVFETNSRCAYAKYESEQGTLLVFASANQAKTLGWEGVEQFQTPDKPRQRLSVGYIKGYDGFSTQLQTLEGARFLPFFLLNGTCTSLRVVSPKPAELKVSLFF
jgi:hypothetical protein